MRLTNQTGAEIPFCPASTAGHGRRLSPLDCQEYCYVSAWKELLTEMSSTLTDDYDIDLTVSFIVSIGAKNVALQFPDELLRDAPSVVSALYAATRRHPDAAEASIAVLGDTSYGSCCVDEVAAAHMPADAIIHYGHSCHSAPATLPVLYVFRRASLDAIACAAQLTDVIGRASDAGRRVLLLWDSAYAHAVPGVLKLLSPLSEAPTLPTPPCPEPYRVQFTSPLPAVLTVPSFTRASFPAATTLRSPGAEPATASPAVEPAAAAGILTSADGSRCSERVLTVAGLSWTPAPLMSAEGGAPKEEQTPWDEAELVSLCVFYVGSRSERARALLATFAGQDVWQFDPVAAQAVGDGAVRDGGTGLSAPVPTALPPSANLISGCASRLMSRRYRNVEAVRNARILGVVVSTLGAARHNALIAALRAAAVNVGKGCYVLALGRLSPAKLANFAEIDAFVLIACPETTLLPDAGPTGSAAFFKPVVSPYEALVALDAGPAWTGRAELDFGRLLAATTDAAALEAVHREGGRGLVEATWAAADGEHAADGSDALSEAVAAAVGAAQTGRGGAGSIVSQASHAAEYFKTQRRWQGLEYELPRDDEGASRPASDLTSAVQSASGGCEDVPHALVPAVRPPRSTAPVEGRSGRAAGYAGEPSVP